MTLIGSNHLPLLASGTATVVTAGTPVRVSAIKGKKLRVQSVENNGDSIIVVGEASTVDGTTTPPVGIRVLYATQSEIFEAKDTSVFYIDSNGNSKSVHFEVYG